MDYVDRFTIVVETSHLPVTEATLQQIAEWSRSVGMLTFGNETSVRDSLRFARSPFQCLDFRVGGRLLMDTLLQLIVDGLWPLKAHISAVCLHCYREGEQVRVPLGRSREQLWPAPKR